MGASVTRVLALHLNPESRALGLTMQIEFQEEACMLGLTKAITRGLWLLQIPMCGVVGGEVPHSPHCWNAILPWQD